MSRFFLLLALALSWTALSAQRVRFQPQTHEIGFQLGQLNHLPDLSERYLSELPFSAHALNGLRYKYHLSLKDALRAGVARRKANFQPLDSPPSLSLSEQTKTDWDFRLGYERKHSWQASVLFAGADALASRGEVASSGTLANGEPIAEAYQYWNLGGEIFVGYRHFFSPYLSLTAEIGTYGSKIQLDEPMPTSTERPALLLESFEWGLNGSVYLSLHFVKLKKRCTCPKVRR